MASGQPYGDWVVDNMFLQRKTYCYFNQKEIHGIQCQTTTCENGHDDTCVIYGPVMKEAIATKKRTHTQDYNLIL